MSVGVRKKVYKCKLCNAQFFTSSGLRKHQHSQHISGASEYSCDVGACTRVFKTLEGLKLHKLNTHCDSRPFECKM